jgi:DNA-binding transcriptional regulator YhcF (GntR family)
MKNLNSIKINIDLNSGETKLQQLINELCRIIKTRLNEGDLLPSINFLSNYLNISRDTVFKAYSELKRRKIVDSTPTKGYFVTRDLKKVLLMLDFYSPFKDIVYREIEKNLNHTYSIDLVFHHYNRKLFDSVILESIGQYNVYIVMNFDIKNFRFSSILKKIDPAKLLLLDIPVDDSNDFYKDNYNYLWQDFNDAVYYSLEKIYDKIKRYKSFNYVNPYRLEHPSISLKAFSRFCRKYKIKYTILNSSITDSNIRKGDVYFVLRQSDLYSILLECKKKQYKPGFDIGILAYNNIPLYEFVSSGITVISADFKEMGRKASLFITKGNTMKDIIPTKIILRNSL